MFGKTTLGLTYSLVLSEGLLSPAIPSVAARAGGIFFPLAKALCLACGSDPEKGTQKVMGAYLMKVWPRNSLNPLSNRAASPGAAINVANPSCR